MKGTYFRLVSAVEADRASLLRSAVRDRTADCRYYLDKADLSYLPGSVFAYWAPQTTLALFRDHLSLSEADLVACRTNSVDNDFRYTRLQWETVLSSEDSEWVPWAKGGDPTMFYSSMPNVISWDRRRQTYPGFIGTKSRPQSRPASVQYFFRPGITWPRRSSTLAMKVLPAGCVFGDKGPALFVPDDSGEALEALIAILSSRPFSYLLHLQVARTELAKSFEVGLVQSTPIPALSDTASGQLSDLARRSWSLTRSLDTVVETSHAFSAPAAVQAAADSLGRRVESRSTWLAEVGRGLKAARSAIDDLCFELYGVSEVDRRVITDGFDITESNSGVVERSDSTDRDLTNVDPSGLAAGLVSWAVGVGVGRFDVRLATGESGWPVEPDPFDALPACSAGMLTGDDGLPLAVTPVGYPVGVSPVLVDEPGHLLDVTARVRSVFDVVFGVDADEWWVDVGSALGARDGEVAGWLRKGFFGHHLKTYSKSRRKAPILWPLGTASGSYLVWLYAHGVTGDSLFQVLNDIVEPKLSVGQRRLVELSQEAGPNPSASQRKEIDTEEKFVGELRELRDELEAVTALWAPDLNDGIVVVLAPLWKLFGHHKPWSKELKKHWDKLAAGDYDWAQLAMHLWPERVIPRCAEDRSLAIAHDLEDVFWVQDTDNTDKWHARTTPTTPIDELVADRHNPAAKAALQKANT